jgi:transposase-like protein
MGRESREIWAKRVERWRDSGLSVKEFARELGVNHNTLAGWRYRLRVEELACATSKHAGESTARSGAKSDERKAIEFVELARASTTEQRFEVVAANGWIVRVPVQFDGETLRRLLAIVERA